MSEEKIVIKEVHHYHETTEKVAWESGSFAGLIVLTLFIPIVGFILGIINVRNNNRSAQATTLLVLSIFSWFINMQILKGMGF